MNRARIATTNDNAGIKALWRVCFHDSEQFTDWFFENRYAPTYTACIEEDGRIVSAMQSWPLHMQIRNRIVPAAIIAGVSTHPDFEGRGYMSTMFRFYMDQMRRKGIVVTPHTPANLPTFFSKGHYPVSDTAYLEMEKVKTDKLSRISSQPLSGPLDDLYACYDKISGRYSGIINRSLSDYKFKCNDYAADGARLLVIRNGLDVIGYVIYYDTDEGIFAEEFIADKKSVQEQLADDLMARANNRKLRIKLPPDHQLQLDPFIQKRPQGVLGVADLSAFLQIVCKNQRFIAAVHDPVIPDHNHTFDFAGNIVNQQPHIEISAGHLVQLLVGYKSLFELEAENNVQIFNRQMAHEIDLFLPKCTCFILDEY